MAVRKVLERKRSLFWKVLGRDSVVYGPLILSRKGNGWPDGVTQTWVARKALPGQTVGANRMAQPRRILDGFVLVYLLFEIQLL